jgi:hypothetical protein
MAQLHRKGVKMALTKGKSRLAAILIGIAVAGALAPGGAASAEGNPAPREQLYVNPSTGYVTAAPPAGETVHVNPSTGFASVGEPAASNPVAMSRSTEQATTAEASDGFDWASAGIGAAAGAGLVLALMLSLATVGVGGLTRPRRAS